ncbi:MaoC family dehydratase [Nocardioides baekrokdamisoli]|uniref:MaoC family dehydratase n=1 Tax=Nocardioides baekrokdamisoli TaxID=1804624 RepID=A0A3G9J1T7_9ACTN|nr:MaoC family dehydratase [Nocardioides baekrokdamisoli]BBH18633.1 MaoC family dehydratase [Nocardioides baekrokdamisoli]
MAVRVFSGVEELQASVGEHLGFSEWLTITQDRIDAFADATGDHQWIHVDPERAADGPFGTTIAHGFLTLSLMPVFGQQVYRIDGVKAALNYGSDKVRFIAPVPVGSRLRGGVLLKAVTPTALGFQMATTITIELEGSDKPACVIEMLVVLVP